MHYLRKFLNFIIFLLFAEFSAGRKIDTLSTGEILKYGDVLISPSKTFTLQFFSTEMSSNCYLGISYREQNERRFVWVANRDNPINGRSGVVSFQTPNNKLVIHGFDMKEPIWSTSFLGQGKSYSAQLLDTGNLIVFEGKKKEVIAWQSFDHPTDTWLPDMKLGFSRITGLNWSLTSWKSFGDPGTGTYTLKMDLTPEFSELYLYNGLNRIGRTGPLNGAHLDKGMFNFTYFYNEDGVYITYGMREPSTFSLIWVSPNGFLRTSEWDPDILNWTDDWTFPEEECDRYNLCGPNKYCAVLDTSLSFECRCFPEFEPKNKTDKLGEACVKKRDSNVCRNGEGFVKFSSMKMPDTRTARVGTTTVWKECEDECLRDCNCTAYANATEMGIACVMWYGDLLDARKYGTGGQDLFVRVDAVELAQYGKRQQHSSSSNNKLKVPILVTSIFVVSVTFIVIFIFCGLAYMMHKRINVNNQLY